MLGLGFLAGAVCYAQDPVPPTVPDPRTPPPQQDTTPDTLAYRRAEHSDSIKALYHPDTTKSRAAFAHAPMPALLEPGQDYRWDRTALVSMGALTLTDLLDRVPGFTGFRAGWISTPMHGAYLGDIARVRVFWDGIELDALDSRLHGPVDLATIQVWALEEVVVERGASELRVYCRSWRVDRTTPYSRADVFTGNEQTNLYRALYGQRFGPGYGLQVAANQTNNTGSFGGGGAQTSIMVRLGYATGNWSFDGFAIRYQRGRDALQSSDPFLPVTIIPNLESTRTDAYFRVGYGDPDRGRPWLQLIASSMAFKNTSAAGSTTTVIDSLTGLPTTTGGRIDSVTSESQYVVTGGATILGFRLSAADRYRVIQGVNYNSSELRASFDHPLLSASALVQLSAFEEGRPDTGFVRQGPTLYDEEELSARFSPLSFVRFVGTASRTTPKNIPGLEPATTTALRLEAGLRVHRDLWLSGGVLTRDTTVVSAPVVYDTTARPAGVGRSTAAVASLRGRLWKEIYVDLSGIDWNQAAPYRPKYEGHAEAYVRTELLHRFPRHTFGFKFGVAYDYRSSTQFLFKSSPTASYTVGDSRVISILAEIRIMQGTLSWQLRNASGYPYYLIPGYQMPRQVNIYGLRWEFWN